MADSIPTPHPGADLLTEIESGDGLSLSAAGRLFPGHRGGIAVDPSTVHRWLTRGSRAADGRVVRLEAVRVGGRWLTSRGAVGRFVEALTAAAPPVTAPPAPRTATARRRHIDASVTKLESKGA